MGRRFSTWGLKRHPPSLTVLQLQSRRLVPLTEIQNGSCGTPILYVPFALCRRYGPFYNDEHGPFPKHNGLFSLSRYPPSPWRSGWNFSLAGSSPGDSYICPFPLDPFTGSLSTTENFSPVCAFWPDKIRIGPPYRPCLRSSRTFFLGHASPT